MSDGDLGLIHNAVLEMLRRGQSVSNVCIILNEELEKISDVSEYVQAIKESDFRP